MATIKDRRLDASANEMSLQYIYPPCAQRSTLTTWSMRTIRRGAEQYYDGPEHRPLPENLIANMTPRGPLRRYTEDYVLHQRITPLIWGAPLCVPPATYYKVEQVRTPVKVCPAIIDDLDATGLTDLRLKIKDVRQNLAEYVGEFKETCDMFLAAGDRVVDTVRTVRKHAGSKKPFKAPDGRIFRIPKDWRSWIKKIPGAYLVSAFVLVPTLSDANDALEKANALRVRPIRRRIVVTKKKELDESVAGAAGGECSHTGQLSKRWIVYVTYSHELGDFTWGNPLEAIWAGVPFSWVVDYFINAGDYLSSMDAMTGVVSAHGVTTTKEVKHSWDTSYGAGWTVLKPGRYSYLRFERKILTSIPMGSVSWEPSGSWKRLSYLSSVLLQLKL